MGGVTARAPTRGESRDAQNGLISLMDLLGFLLEAFFPSIFIFFHFNFLPLHSFSILFFTCFSFLFLELIHNMRGTDSRRVSSRRTDVTLHRPSTRGTCSHVDNPLPTTSLTATSCLLCVSQEVSHSTERSLTSKPLPPRHEDD